MFLLRAVLNILVRNASPRGPMCLGACNVVSLYVVCCSVNVSVCFVCCVLDSVCELFGETIHNVCGCSCYFVVECYGCV